MLSYQVFEIVLSLVKYGALDRLDDRLMISGQFKSLPPSLKEWAKRKNFDRKKAMTECTNRDGPGCIVCGTLDDLQIDHIHPIARGGGNEIGNLQILCGECNREKRTKTMYDWIADS